MRLIVHAAVLLGPASQSPSSPRRSTADRRFLVVRPLPEESKRQTLPETTHFCEPRLLSLFFINPFAPSFPSAAHSTSARRCLTCTSILKSRLTANFKTTYHTPLCGSHTFSRPTWFLSDNSLKMLKRGRLHNRAPNPHAYLCVKITATFCHNRHLY